MIDCQTAKYGDIVQHDHPLGQGPYFVLHRVPRPNGEWEVFVLDLSLPQDYNSFFYLTPNFAGSFIYRAEFYGD